MKDSANGSGGFIRRRWATISIFSLTVLVLSPFLVMYFIPAKYIVPAKYRERATELYTYRFAASKNRFAFLRQEGEGRRDLIVYSVTEKKITIYRPRSLNIWTLSPSASNDGEFFIGCSRGVTPDQFRAGQRVPTTLFQCRSESCSPLFEFEGSIESAIDLGNGEVIFIGAKPQITRRSFPPSSPEFVGYRNFDLYFRTGDGQIQRLTDWEAAMLQSASLGKGKILFSFYASFRSHTPQTPGFPTIKSNIWAAKITYEDGIPRLAFEGDRPFIEHGKNFDTEPYVSPDGRRTAFVSSSEYANKERRYDIVVVDNASKQELITIAPEAGSKLSLPVFVNDDVIRFMSFDGQRYSFREVSVSTKQEQLLGQATADDLAKAEVVYVEGSPADAPTRRASSSTQTLVQ
jgi:hypothetical protein